MADALAFDGLTEGLRVELWNRDLRCAESRRRKHGGKVSNMKQGCCMQVDGAFCVSHPVVEVVDIGQDISVSHHYTLGPASRAARVNESQYRIRVVHNLGRNVVSNLQGILIEHPLPRYPARWGG